MLPNRKSPRWQAYDYHSEGMYFITICTKKGKHHFGKIENHKMILNLLGQHVAEEWLKTPQLRADMKLSLGVFVIMPNHFHGIIHIGKNTSLQNGTYTRNISHGKSLGPILRGFKSAVTSYAHKNNYPGFEWHNRYHDRVIRNEKEYALITDYILNNPARWQHDRFRTDAL